MQRMFAGRLLRCVHHGRPPCLERCVQHLSAHSVRSSQRRSSPYSSVDTARYSALLKSVVSQRVSSQTPETLEEENQLIYGPVVESQTQAKRQKEPREPKILHPFTNSDGARLNLEGESVTPTRILIEKGQDRSLVPSVTRVLQRTLSPEQVFYLERWKKRMVAELGEEGFKEYSQELFRQGKLFHRAVEDILTPEDLGKAEDRAVRAPEVRGYLDSISYVLEDISAVRAIESAVQHRTLNYLGVVDCVARYRGVLCVIDWKTSEKPKRHLQNTYDNPVQVAAYAGALNHDDNYTYQVENGLIVVAYKDGSPGDVHLLSSELLLEFWRKWLVRLQDFTEQK